METRIGRCSLCGGAVVKETGPYWSTVPPVAHCSSCGATEAPPDRVIPMVPASPQRSPKDLASGYLGQSEQSTSFYAHQQVESERFWRGDGWRREGVGFGQAIADGQRSELLRLESEARLRARPDYRGL
jgi:hypothetical protein